MTAVGYDRDNDQLFYKFLLNGRMVQNWSSNNSWNWITEDSNSGNNTIEVQIRDGKHANIEAFDDKKSANFMLIALNMKPAIIKLATDKGRPVDINTPITWTIEAHDPENDFIFYKFFLNGSVIKDWSTENVWIWTADRIGISQIEVWIRDGKHVGLESTDDNRIRQISVLECLIRKPSISNLFSK